MGNDERHSNEETRRHAPTQHAASKRTRWAEGAKAGFGGTGDAGPLITRRRLLYGAAGVGAAAVVGAGAMALAGAGQEGTPNAGIAAGQAAPAADDVPLDVPESSLVTLNDFEVLENAEDGVELVGSYDLKYGTLVWACDDDVAACLLPTDSGSPLTKIALLNLGSGNLATVRKKAVGAAERFEIYDVRASSAGLVWTEANVLDGTWRIYASELSGDTAGEPVLLEEGDATYDTPTLAVCGKRAFWQVMPKLPNDAELPSRLMGATFGKDDAAVVFESPRLFGTPPYSADGVIVIAPRSQAERSCFRLTTIDAKTGDVGEQLTLPRGMAPLEAGYGNTGFMFSIPDIYDNATAISNLGTYTPVAKPEAGDYASGQWFGFARTPSAAPAWCNGLLIVKSSYSVCGVDLARSRYFAIDVDDGADTFGDYLASSGTHPTFVTYSNIDHNPVNGSAIHACRVKVWRPTS